MSLQRLSIAISFLSFVLFTVFALTNFAEAKPRTYLQASSVGCSGAMNTKYPEDSDIFSEFESCKSRAKEASTVCFEETSPKIQTGMTVVGALLAAVKTASPADACSGFGKAMDAAKNVISAFNVVCGGAHAFCDSGCSSATESIELRNHDIDAKIVTTNQEAAAAQASNNAVLYGEKIDEVARLKLRKANLNVQKTCSVTLQKTCNSYTAQLTAGAAGVLSAVISAKQASKCNNEASATPTPVDCSISANATLAQCICEKTPRASGCSGYVSNNTINSASADSATGGGTNNNNSNGSNPVGDSPNTDDSSIPGGRSSGGGAGMAAGGGGSGIDGGLGGATGGAGKKDLDKKTGINTNILGGDYGGGGGGGSRGSGRSSSDEAMQSQYKNYLPGGKNDPSRNVANDAYSQQVTGDGKSNWDKVRERYSNTRLVGE